MSRRLRSGGERILGRHDGARGRTFDAHFRALVLRLGPFDRLARSYASATAALWCDFTDTEHILTDAQRQRREGKGRRPSVSQIARLQKRQGLAWQSYDGALKRLEELASHNGHGPRDLLADLDR